MDLEHAPADSTLRGDEGLSLLRVKVAIDAALLSGVERQSEAIG